MNKVYRPINTNELADTFVREILGISDDESTREAVSLIILAEKAIDDAYKYPTVTHEKFRERPYATAEQRRKLRTQIFEELITMKRICDDEEIKLGNGGCVPLTKLKKKRQFYFVTGLPASGKSFLANKLCDDTGSMLLDSDYAKRKLPEFHYRIGDGASLVHKESQVIIMGDYKDEHLLSVLEYSIAKGFNMVYPCIGNKLDEIIELTKKMKACNYDSHLILVDLDRLKATRRAYTRYKNTKRYIPLSKIYDEYANDPALTYYRAKERYPEMFISFSHIDTDVDMKKRYSVIDKTESSPVKKYIPRKYRKMEEGVLL